MLGWFDIVIDFRGGGVPQLGEAEVRVGFRKMPECSSRICAPYASFHSLHSLFTSSRQDFNLELD